MARWLSLHSARSTVWRNAAEFGWRLKSRTVWQVLHITSPTLTCPAEESGKQGRHLLWKPIPRGRQGSKSPERHHYSLIQLFLSPLSMTLGQSMECSLFYLRENCHFSFVFRHRDLEGFGDIGNWAFSTLQLFLTMFSYFIFEKKQHTSCSDLNVHQNCFVNNDI